MAVFVWNHQMNCFAIKFLCYLTVVEEDHIRRNGLAFLPRRLGRQTACTKHGFNSVVYGRFQLS